MCHHFCRNEVAVKDVLIYWCFIPTFPYCKHENAVLASWEWRQCDKGRSPLALSTKKPLIHHSGHCNILDISTKCGQRKKQLMVRLTQLLLYWAELPRQMLKGDSKPKSGWYVGVKKSTLFMCPFCSQMCQLFILLSSPSAHWLRWWHVNLPFFIPQE